MLFSLRNRAPIGIKGKGDIAQQDSRYSTKGCTDVCHGNYPNAGRGHASNTVDLSERWGTESNHVLRSNSGTYNSMPHTDFF